MALNEVAAGIGIAFAFRGEFALGGFVKDDVGPFTRTSDGIRRLGPVNRQLFIEETAAGAVHIKEPLTEERAHLFIRTVADGLALGWHECAVDHHRPHVVADGADIHGHLDAVTRTTGRADRNHVDAGELLHHVHIEVVAAGGKNHVLGVNGDGVALGIFSHHAFNLTVLVDKLLCRRGEQQRAALGLKGFNHGLWERTGARIDMPRQISLVTPGGLHFLPMHAVVVNPLDRVAGEINEGLHQRCIDAPVVISSHFIEGLNLRELDAFFLLHEGFRGKRTFHKVAGTARKGILLKHQSFEAALNGAHGRDCAARTSTDHNDVNVIGLVSCPRRSKSHGHCSRDQNLLHISFSLFNSYNSNI